MLGGGWHFSNLIFHLEITLLFAKVGYAFEEKSFFPATIILWEKKKKILRCLEMNLCVCVRKFGWVGLGG